MNESDGKELGIINNNGVVEPFRSSELHSPKCDAICEDILLSEKSIPVNEIN